MASEVRFFAWAAPANDMNVLPDHTWVTTYDSRVNSYENIKKVVGANEHFWYCWGNFRSKAGTPGNLDGALGDRLGDLAEALCLVKPDAHCIAVTGARGTIFRYGWNGVCHQLANQVLYATSSEGHAPLTVSRARGYWASTFRYGTYGIPDLEWDIRRDICRNSRSLTPQQSEGGNTMVKEADEFESRARDLLKDRDPKLLSEFLALRQEAQALPTETSKGAKGVSAKAINADNQRMLDRAATLLGAEDFERIFEFQPEQRVNLVPPRSMYQSQNRSVNRRALGEAATDKDLAPRRASIPATPKRWAPAHGTERELPRKQAKTIDPMTKSQLIEKIYENTELSKKDVRGVLETLATIGYKELKKTGVFLVPGFAKFVVIKKSATKSRKGTNPFTGEPMTFKARPARKIVRVRPVKTAKDAV
jgi:nucleoid DNA-binding protein